jgi:predicted metalloprotease with PDZ domain
MGIGVRVVEVDGQEAEVSITYVWPDSPAAEAGLLEGDRVVAVNGVRISPEQFRSLTRRLLPGDPISLTLEGTAGEREATLVAGTVPPREVMVRARLQRELEAVRERMVRILSAEDMALVDRASGEIVGSAPTIVVEGVEADSLRTLVLRGLAGDSLRGPIRIAFSDGQGGEYTFSTRWPRGLVEAEAEAAASAASISAARATAQVTEELVRPLAPFIVGANRVAGAEVRALNAGLSAYFEVETGVLVTNVAPGTPAADAGLRPGDVIQRVDGREVSQVEGVREALADPRVQTHRLDVVRRGESLTLSLR